MGVQIPTFADLPVVNPQPATPQPQYPQEDPGAAAESALGGAISKAGGTLVDVGAYNQMARNKMDRAMADANFFATAGQIDAQLKAETDPAKITALGQQYRQAAQSAAGAFGDQAARQLWLAQTEKHVAVGEKGAELRNLGIWRDSYKAGILSQADSALKTAEQSGDTRAYEIARDRISNLADAAVGAGAMSAVQGEELRQHASTRIDRGLTAGRVESLANYGLGIGPAPAGAQAGGMQVGGAIAGRVAQVAAAQNVDPTTALATAQIESSMGRNLGSRGNIFQLGKTEWSSVGGGRMGDPDTDIQNGVAFLGQKQQELASALGRDPQPWEIYLAHQQGTAGALALLNNPDKPAGQVVPAQNISANGGDPSAPASAFVGKWRANFRTAAAKVGGGAAASASPSGGFDLAAGDSIAVGSIRHGGIGGNAVTLKGDPGAADADAAGGRNPQEALDYIQTHPDRFAGKTVLWSSGLMNAGASGAQAALPVVEQQIDALKAAGANVVLAGVDQGKFGTYNAALSAIADDKGIPFAGPLPTSNIHPSRDGYAQYASAAAKLIPSGGGADQLVGQPAAPSAAAPGAQDTQQPNRTGLPPLTDQFNRIFSAPGFNDAEREAAWNRAKAKYTAMEADAARAERLDAARQKQVETDATNRIWADVYSGNPQISAQQIAVDPAFNANPERRKAMIELVNNPPGSGIPAPQSYAAAQSLIDRMRLPEGDPNKITTQEQVFDHMRELNRTDLDFVLKKFSDLSSPGDSPFKHRLEEFFKGVTPQIDRSGALPGLPQDARGKAKAFEFQRMVEDQVSAYKAAGKNPDDLINPKKPDYLGSPETLKPYKRTFTEALADFQNDNNGPLGASGADLSTPAALKAAVAGGKITREQGEAEALRRGWIRPAPAPEPGRPDLTPLGR